jgi:hypothetical protein
MENPHEIHEQQEDRKTQDVAGTDGWFRERLAIVKGNGRQRKKAFHRGSGR